MTTEIKRYDLTISFFIYAKDDDAAKRKAERIIAHRRKKYDDQAQIVTLHSRPFASYERKTLINNLDRRRILQTPNGTT